MIHQVDSRLEIDIIPNGVDLSVFQPGSRKPFGGTLTILCVGRLIERKGQHHLIQAAKRLIDDGIDVQVNLVGTGDSLVDFQQLAEQLGIASHIHFIGYIPREEITRYYAEADVFVLPSYNEGLSLAALEAIASGLPLILTRTGGTNDLVEEGVNGFTFDWGDINRLSELLRKFTQNPKMCSQMGSASKKRSYKFSLEAVAERYMNLFHLVKPDRQQQLLEYARTGME